MTDEEEEMNADSHEQTDQCPGGSKSPRDPSFNPDHDFEGLDHCRQCGQSKYREEEE